ncbi:hypothetical protein BpHYR1_025196 [Brachionus plicatilis]|uniref:Uncharacterized protein n=1 Tax=Brachionus plicatilis TaxID=10195 RepID=A0A3M7SVB7_BRAPC|nr:hypothetical protein BpHYR1_025196 [Brachionus plicatilis]
MKLELVMMFGQSCCPDNKYFKAILVFIPLIFQKIFKSSLPKNIVLLIKELRKVRRLFQKTNCPSPEKDFNRMTSEAGFDLKEFWTQN